MFTIIKIIVWAPHYKTSIPYLKLLLDKPSKQQIKEDLKNSNPECIELKEGLIAVYINGWFDIKTEK